MAAVWTPPDCVSRRAEPLVKSSGGEGSFGDTRGRKMKTFSLLAAIALVSLTQPAAADCSGSGCADPMERLPQEPLFDSAMEMCPRRGSLPVGGPPLLGRPGESPKLLDPRTRLQMNRNGVLLFSESFLRVVCLI
jgi:hypothetical protein